MHTLKEFYNTRELASLLGITEKCLLERARREGWTNVKREERGGGFLWRYCSMPERTQQQIITSHACRHAVESVCKQVSQPVNTSGQQNNLAGLPEHGQSKAMARAIIARAALQIQQETEKDAASVHHELSNLVAKRKAPVPEWIYQYVRKASRSAIRDWTVKLQREGIRRLGKGHEKRRPRNIIDNTPKLQDFVLGMLYEFPHVSAAEIERGLIARFGPEGTEEDLSIKLPCLRRIQIWLKKWKRANAALLLAHENPDASRSKNKVAFGDAAAHIRHMNQEWQSDGTKADLMLNDGRRHTLNLTVDIYSRRLLFRVSRTSSAAAVASGLGKCIRTWGVPDTWKTDNGSDYKNAHMDRVCVSLEIDHELCPPFSPEKKPFVERAFKTFLYSHAEIMPGFVGHNVAERKAIESRKSFAERLFKKLMTPGEVVEMNISPEELQKICDQWAEHVYGNEPHSGLDGMTPNEKAAAYDGAVRRIEDERALDVLLSPCPGGNGLRVVTKKGIRVTSKQHGLTIKGHYIGTDLATLIGRQVLVRLDEARLGVTYLFDPETGEYLGKAEHPGWLGWSAEDVRNVAVASARKQKADMAVQKRGLRNAAKRAGVKDISREILETAVRKGSKEAPTSARQAIAHTTTHLNEAARVHTGDLTPPTPEQRAALMSKFEVVEQGFVPPTDDSEIVSTWMFHYRAMMKGELIPEDVFAWMETARKNNHLLCMCIKGKGINPEKKLEQKTATPVLAETGVPAQ